MEGKNEIGTPSKNHEKNVNQTPSLLFIKKQEPKMRMLDYKRRG